MTLKIQNEVTQLDIAPTIAKIYGLDYHCAGSPIKEVVNRFYGSKTILIIIDSLGFDEYIKYADRLPLLTKAAGEGLLYKCLTFIKLTTPSIASILCGLKPEIHRVYKTGDVYKSSVKSLPEYLSENGIRSGVIMESSGAITFIGKIDIVAPIEDREDIVSFDYETLSRTIEIIDRWADFIVAHFRILDKYGYNSETLNHVNSILMKINQSLPNNWILTICGDHPPHKTKQLHVPLIFSNKL